MDVDDPVVVAADVADVAVVADHSPAVDLAVALSGHHRVSFLHNFCLIPEPL